MIAATIDLDDFLEVWPLLRAKASSAIVKNAALLKNEERRNYSKTARRGGHWQ